MKKVKYYSIMTVLQVKIVLYSLRLKLHFACKLLVLNKSNFKEQGRGSAVSESTQEKAIKGFSQKSSNSQKSSASPFISNKPIKKYNLTNHSQKNSNELERKHLMKIKKGAESFISSRKSLNKTLFRRIIKLVIHKVLVSIIESQRKMPISHITSIQHE